MNTTTATAPAYIARDTYQGRWTTPLPRGHRADAYTAAELAALAPKGIIWEAFGHVDGVEFFCRTRYVADASGALHCYTSSGDLSIVHPADRELRILTQPEGR